MAGEHKDRLGDKLRNVEAAREDQWARKRDAELIEVMRGRLARIACPNCKQFLIAKTEAGLKMQACPGGHGAWLDAAALKSALKEHKLAGTKPQTTVR